MGKLDKLLSYNEENITHTKEVRKIARQSEREREKAKKKNEEKEQCETTTATKKVPPANKLNKAHKCRSK